MHPESTVEAADTPFQTPHTAPLQATTEEACWLELVRLKPTDATRAALHC